MIRHPSFFLSALVAASLVAGGPVSARFLVARTGDDVVAIDLTDGSVVSHYGIPREIRRFGQVIEWDGEGFLLSDATSRRLWRVSATFHDPVPLFDLPSAAPKDAAFHDGKLFLIGQSASTTDSLYVLDPVSGEVTRTFAIPDSIGLQAGLESDGTHLWAVDSSESRLWRCDPTSGTFDLYYPLPNALTLPVAWDPDLGELWLIDNLSDTVFTMDRASGALTTRFALDPSVAVVWSAITLPTVTPILPTTWGSLKETFR